MTLEEAFRVAHNYKIMAADMERLSKTVTSPIDRVHLEDRIKPVRDLLAVIKTLSAAHD